MGSAILLPVCLVIGWRPNPVQRADSAVQRADAVLRKTVAVYAAMKAISQEAVWTIGTGADRGTQRVRFRAVRPNRFRVETRDDTGLETETVYDGTKGWRSVKSLGWMRMRTPTLHDCLLLSASSGTHVPFHANGLSGLKEDLFGYPKYSTAPRYAGRERIGGVTYDTVESVMGRGEPIECRRKVYVDAKGVLRRIVDHTNSEGHMVVSTEVVRQLVVNPTLKASDFVFTPPPGLEQVGPP